MASENFLKTKQTVQTLVRSLKYVYELDKGAFVVRNIVLTIITFSEIFLIDVVGKFIDSTAEILTSWSTFTFRGYFVSESFRWLAVSLVVWIVIKGATNIGDFMSRRISYAIDIDSFSSVIKKIGSENMQEVEQRRFQDLLTFVPTYSITRIYQAYDTFVQVVRQLVKFVMSMVILYQAAGISVLFIFLISIAEPVAQYLGEKKILKYRKNNVEKLKYVDYQFATAITVSNFAELRVDGIFGHLRDNYVKRYAQFIKSLINMLKHYYIDGAFFAVIGQVLLNLYNVFLLYKSFIEKITIGEFTALYNYASVAYDSSYNMISSSFKLLDHISYVDEFFSLLDYEGFGDVDSGIKRLKKGAPRLELLKLDFAFQDDPDTKVLEDVTLSIKPGEKIALVGGDGSGKSTLAKILCGLYQIQSGDYIIDNYSIREIERGQLKQKLSVVLQDFVRYNFSIQENISLSAEKKALNKDLYNEVKKITGVDKFMKKENLTDSQKLGKHFSDGIGISPGYWQRIAIARMLYRNRQVFIMDEPFTYIDGPSRADILDRVIDFIGEERTLIYISQNTDHLKKFDRVYYLHNGKVVEEGTYRELIKKHGEFYKETKANQ
ncbi:ABC transporter ATP-binding protein [Candidatus Dojkabacteria bacterium]|uniref:ABC transporter ATP-binding protein n=1 Tax=Candidatus Dojkabacteria bacterium TaxID=2099670 RepID=A0A955I5A4_9BACT|nr:ABC transporter ATP-binding protein [Candidatus Dojkabacteria bacterium]MCB9790895.1 ABC transporter ATP-binding protein [Candidatus Nomurabacteria bacterium]